MSTTGWSTIPHVILSVGFSGMSDDYCAKSLCDITTVKCLRSPRHNILKYYLSSASYPLFTRSLTIFRDPNWSKHLSLAFKIPLLIEESYQDTPSPYCLFCHSSQFSSLSRAFGKGKETAATQARTRLSSVPFRSVEHPPLLHRLRYS